MVSPTNFTINSNYPAQAKVGSASQTITFTAQSIPAWAERTATINIPVASSDIINPSIRIYYNNAGLTGEIFLGYGWAFQGYDFRDEIFIQRTSPTNVRVDIYTQNIDSQGRTLWHDQIDAVISLNVFTMP